MELAICIFLILLLAGIAGRLTSYDIPPHSTTYYISGGSYYEPKKEWNQKWQKR